MLLVEMGLVVLGRLGTVISLDQSLKHEEWRFSCAILLAILAVGR